MEEEPGPDPDPLFDEKRPNKLLDVASQSWKAGLYTDITIVVGTERFPAHRLVLASLSDYFPPLLKFDENDAGEITLHNIEPEGFSIILNYAYTGQVDINKNNVQSIFIANDYLNICYVKEVCVKFMIANLDIENVCEVLLFALQYTILELVDKATDFVKHNMYDVSKTDSFPLLDAKFLEHLFLDETLILYFNSVPLKSVQREKLILTSVLRYLSKVSVSNPELVEMMIRTVRLSQIPKDVIMKCLENFKILQDNIVIKKYVGLGEVVAKYLKEKKRDSSSKASAHPYSRDIPDTWFHTRQYLTFLLAAGRRRYAAAGQIEPNPNNPEYVHSDSNLEIKRIEIWLRIWENKTVIAGLSLSYRSDDQVDNLVYQRGHCPNGQAQHVVELEPNEFIIKVIVGSGFLIDRLGFETNRGRVLGPYGGPGGSEYTEFAKTGDFSYLFDINCDTVNTHESDAIFNLMLRWIQFK